MNEQPEVTLTRELVRIPSISGSEQAIAKYLAARLKSLFMITLQPVGDRWNLLAVRGTPKVLLTAHMDTVPKALPVREDEEFIYGRGACDTKGSVAAMVCAAENAARDGLEDFGLLFDVSEETDFSGIADALTLVRPIAVVVGEPTGNAVVAGQRGLLGIVIRCNGKAAPGAMPERGESAIVKLLAALARLDALPLPSSVYGVTTKNIGLIRGGVAANVVPDSAEATVEFRTTVPNDEFLALLREQVDGFGVLYSFDPVLPSSPAEGLVVPYFTEMYFWSKSAKTLVYGPGEYTLAHTDEERVPKSELIEAREWYERFLRERCTIAARTTSRRS